MNEGITFRRFAIFYLRYCRTYNAPRTIEGKRRYLLTHVRYFGSVKLRDIKRADIECYIQTQKCTLTNLTINRSLAVLKHIFNYGMALDLADKNPVKGVRFLPEAHKPLNVPARDAVEAWLTWCIENDPLLYDLSAIAVNTGLRRGDILKIRGADIDIERRVLRVAVSKTQGIQYIPLNGTVLAILARRKRDGFIFVNGDTYLKSFRRRFKTARRATRFNFCFRIFRDFFATEMMFKGIHIRIIQRLLGHARLTTTERYLAVNDTDCREAVDKLNVSNPDISPLTAPLPFPSCTSLWAMGDLNLRPPACKAGGQNSCQNERNFYDG